jgi:peptide/nickel transport system substrate-binding protein
VKRRFMLVLMLVGIMVLLVPSLGCSSSESEPEEPEPATLTIAVSQIRSRPTLGGFSGDGVQALRCTEPMMDHLVYMKSDGSGYDPGLAESWTVSADQKSVTFTLRQGVQFHGDWGELTSEDVKFTIDNMLSAENYPDDPNDNFINSVGPMIDSVTANGPYEVTFQLTAPRPDELLGVLSPYYMGAGIACKDYYEQDWEYALTHPVYSGPYEFVDSVLGEFLELKAVQDHWRVETPGFDTIVFKEVPEELTRVAMVSNGEADIAEVTVAQAAVLESTGIDIARIPDAAVLDLYLLGQWLPTRDTYDPDCPFLDIRVRKALNLAINREEIAEEMLGGFAQPSGAYTLDSFSTTLPGYTYDLDQAKQLMADAGYPDGFDLDLWDVNIMGAGAPELKNLLLPVAGYWQDIGVNVNISTHNIVAVYGDIMTRNTTGKMMGQANQTYGGPSGMTYNSTMGMGSFFPLYESTGMQALLDAWLEETATSQERRDLEEQMGQFLYDEYAMVPLVKVDSTYAMGDKVATWSPWNTTCLDIEYATVAET